MRVTANLIRHVDRIPVVGDWTKTRKSWARKLINLELNIVATSMLIGSGWGFIRGFDSTATYTGSAGEAVHGINLVGEKLTDPFKNAGAGWGVVAKTLTYPTIFWEADAGAAIGTLPGHFVGRVLKGGINELMGKSPTGGSAEAAPRLPVPSNRVVADQFNA